MSEIGDLGQVWFLDDLRPVRRHVETITMDSISSATRKLTIDILLPRHGDGSIAWHSGERLFYIPVALLRKTPATLNIDLVREDGHTLPILNRVENAQITWHAVNAVTQRVLRLEGRSRTLMRAYLRGAVFDGRPEFQAAYVAAALGIIDGQRQDLIGAGSTAAAPEKQGATEQASGHPPGPSEELQRLRQLWKDVAANSVIWLALAGMPGERRVIQFSYQVSLRRPPIWPRRTRWVERVLVIDGAHRPFRMLKVGDGNARGLVSRLVNRAATAVGWAGWDIAIDSPYIRRTESYHLQFPAPDGTEVRDISLRAELVNSVGRRRWPEWTNDGDWASLYFFGLRVRREGPAEITLRIGRRGFLSYVTGASVVIAGMLWAFERHANQLANHEVVAVPILLVVPALLALFILRPGEHAVVGRMLSGARAVILLDALICAAAAAAMGGILLAWNTLAAAWHAYAVAATVLAGVLIMSWLLALDSTEALRRHSRRLLRSYKRYGASAIVLCFGACLVITLAPKQSGRSAGDIEWSAGILVLGLTASWVSLFALANTSTLRAIRARALLGAVLRLASAACIVAALLIVQFDFDVTDWANARNTVLYVAIVTALLSVLVEPLRRVGIPAPVQDDPGLWIADVPETWENVDGQPAPAPDAVAERVAGA